MEGCYHEVASVRVGGILGLLGPFPSLSREEILGNDIQEGTASHPDNSPVKGGQEECEKMSL